MIDKAKSAEEQYNQAQEDEKAKLEKMTNLIDQHGENGKGDKKITADIVSFTPEDSNWKVENVKEALDYLYSN